MDSDNADEQPDPHDNMRLVHDVASVAEAVRPRRLRAATAIEPLLGPITDLNLDDIHWVIVGGEIGTALAPYRCGLGPRDSRALP